jgi:hypothetical protein
MRWIRVAVVGGWLIYGTNLSGTDYRPAIENSDLIPSIADCHHAIFGRFHAPSAR